MKHARLVPAALALVLSGCWAMAAVACDKEKNTQASAAAVTADKAAGCTAHGTASAASKAGCSARQTTLTASAGHSCSGKNKGAAYTAGSGNCAGHGMVNAAGKNFHSAMTDCDACADMHACGAELSSAGAHTQIVPLKNGVMFVYTADTPGQVTAVQSAMARRSERMAQFVSAGDKARLCAECRSMRAAMAEGRLVREVVNIEGGSLTLMTSDDPAVVAKIHTMVDLKANPRMKS